MLEGATARPPEAGLEQSLRAQGGWSERDLQHSVETQKYVGADVTFLTLQHKHCLFIVALEAQSFSNDEEAANSQRGPCWPRPLVCLA